MNWLWKIFSMITENIIEILAVAKLINWGNVKVEIRIGVTSILIAIEAAVIAKILVKIDTEIINH